MQQVEISPQSQSRHQAYVAGQTETLAQNRALTVRLAHACIAVGLAVVLLLSFWLKPDPRGLGTHEQLLLLPCNFNALTGLPCPSCGMTTAFAHMARGEVRDACVAQPLGALGFVACVLLLPLAVGAAISGKNAVGAAMRLPWGKLSLVAAAILTASWLFKLALVLQQ